MGMSQTLKESLREWEHTDFAAYKLAICLGILGPDDGSLEQWYKTKWLFWSNHPISNALYDALRKLTDAGVLAIDEDGEKLRWNYAFALVAPPPTT